MRKEHILWTAANAQVTQSDREELWRQVKVAMDAGEPLPADAVGKLPSLCAHCGAGGESGGFKVPGVGSQAPVFAPTLVFHGVPNERVAESIVARGFVEPGDDLEGTPWRRPARWVAFGQGHYASRDLATAAQYGFADADGWSSVLVCLAAVGSRADIPQETSVHRTKVYYPALQGDGLVKRDEFAPCGLLTCDAAAHRYFSSLCFSFFLS
jgi:hypothetical protein